MTTQGGDQFTSGYSLGGDPHQLGVGSADPDEQYAAALTVASREGIPARELLDMLGLTGVARRRRAPGSAA